MMSAPSLPQVTVPRWRLMIADSLRVGSKITSLAIGSPSSNPSFSVTIGPEDASGDSARIECPKGSNPQRFHWEKHLEMTRNAVCGIYREHRFAQTLNRWMSAGICVLRGMFVFRLHHKADGFLLGFVGGISEALTGFVQSAANVSSPRSSGSSSREASAPILSSIRLSRVEGSLSM